MDPAFETCRSHQKLKIKILI